MKIVWALLMLGGIAAFAVGGDFSGAFDALLSGSMDGVVLCAKLAGGYVLFMGLLGIADAAGLTEALARGLGGIISPLFPDVKKGSKAASCIALNISANMLGLGNAATPFGLEAMRELAVLSPGKTASAAMCMLLLVNASNVQIIPTTVIALRAQAGSANPADITLATVIATSISMVMVIALGLAAERFWAARDQRVECVQKNSTAWRGRQQ